MICKKRICSQKACMTFWPIVSKYFCISYFQFVVQFLSLPAIRCYRCFQIFQPRNQSQKPLRDHPAVVLWQDPAVHYPTAWRATNGPISPWWRPWQRPLGLSLTNHLISSTLCLQSFHFNYWSSAVTTSFPANRSTTNSVTDRQAKENFQRHSGHNLSPSRKAEAKKKKLGKPVNKDKNGKYSRDNPPIHQEPASTFCLCVIIYKVFFLLLFILILLSCKLKKFLCMHMCGWKIFENKCCSVYAARISGRKMFLFSLSFSNVLDVSVSTISPGSSHCTFLNPTGHLQ